MKSQCWKLIFLGLSLALTTGCPRPVTNNDTRIYNQDDGGIKAEADGGTINGGGGKGVRCTKDGHTTVEVLDLYEAKSIYNLTPLDLGNDEAKARSTLAKIFARHTHGPGHIPLDDYAVALENDVLKKFIDEKIHYVEAPQTLKPVHDTFEPLLEKGCELVQIAVFYDESALMIDHSLWNQLDVTNRTALMAHELIYAIARAAGVTNSMSSRKLVAHLLSKQGALPLLDGISKSEFSKAFRCTFKTDSIRMGDFYMFAKKDRNGEDFLHVSFGMNSLVNPYLFKTTALIKSVDLRELVSRRPYHLMLGSTLEVDGYSNLTGDVSFQFLGADEGRSNLNGFMVAIPPGKNSGPERMSFKCEVPDRLDQILPSLDIGEGEYKSNKLIRGIYQDTLKVDRIGALEIIHEAEFQDSQGGKHTCSWTEAGIAKKDRDSMQFLLESAESSSRNDDVSPCSKDVESARTSLKSTGYLAYTLDLKDFVAVQKALAK